MATLMCCSSPTKAAEAQFRPTASDAMSYFVGHKAVENGYLEDAGFAINGGKGWSNVVFDNHKIHVSGNVAIAMGNYFFTSAADGSKTKVEYTFGYKKNADGKVRIFLHHSSVPYSVPAATASGAITEEEVKSVQAAWANAIKSISKTYLEGGDYVAAAAKAAGELYGYGHTNVLFKPTKAAEAQFRPTASDAMSYFVGHKAVEKGYLEDAGFAINGGKGWSNVVFDNHQIDVTGNVAIAMGNYFFTSAADGSKTKVEYTFGYKKNADGKVRIFLHHSSVPYSVPAATASGAITEEEVKSVQAAWANAIRSISKTYLDGGDYVAAAAKAAGELYGYGHTNVLFKPTKAAEAQFRPTAQMPCPTLLDTRQSRRVILRMLASPSTVERNGQMWFLTTTKLMSLAMLPLPWATTSSQAQQMAARPKLSTPLATRRMRMARCASSSTIRQCHTACLQPLHLERLLKRK